MQFWAIIVNSFRESLDRKIFWLLIFLTGIISLAMLSIGIDESGISFFFGLWTPESVDVWSIAQVRSKLVGGVVYILLSTIIGWIGVMLMIIATGDVIPSMMERGAVDVLLSKPISRPRLFLYKYIASMTFVLLQGTIFVVTTFLIMGLRWGEWRPGYLGGIVLLLLLFSYIYCVSALVGVLTRSAVASILISIGAWFLFAAVHQAPDTLDIVLPDKERFQTLRKVVTIVGWIPPKTGDFEYIAARWSGTGTTTDVFEIEPANPSEEPMFEGARAIEESHINAHPFLSIGSSLLFEAVVVLLAMWKFSRRDY